MFSFYVQSVFIHTQDICSPVYFSYHVQQIVWLGVEPYARFKHYSKGQKYRIDLWNSRQRHYRPPPYFLLRGELTFTQKTKSFQHCAQASWSRRLMLSFLLVLLALSVDRDSETAHVTMSNKCLLRYVFSFTHWLSHWLTHSLFHLIIIHSFTRLCTHHLPGAERGNENPTPGRDGPWVHKMWNLMQTTSTSRDKQDIKVLGIDICVSDIIYLLFSSPFHPWPHWSMRHTPGLT